MKIGGKKPGIGTENYIKGVVDGGGGSKKSESAGKPRQGDSVNISSAAKDLNNAKKLLEGTPEVRTDMVVRLRTDIERGSYDVDAGKVAEKMIERALKNALYTRKEA